jgi:hypothetical protein
MQIDTISATHLLSEPHAFGQFFTFLDNEEYLVISKIIASAEINAAMNVNTNITYAAVSEKGRSFLE